MKYPGLAKSAQMYGGIGLTAGNSLRTDNLQVLLALACLCRAVVPGLHFENLQVSIITFTFHPTCLYLYLSSFRRVHCVRLTD